MPFFVYNNDNQAKRIPKTIAGTREKLNGGVNDEKRICICLILLLCLTQMTALAETAAPSGQTALDRELAEAAAMFPISEAWAKDWAAPVSKMKMARMIADAFQSYLGRLSGTTEKWLSEITDTSDCYRGEAAIYLYRTALENYYGVANAEKVYEYGAFSYVNDYRYSDTCGEGNATMEHLLCNAGTLPPSEHVYYDIWANAYVAMQVDPDNSLPVMECDADGYIRYDQPITRQEAVLAVKRLLKSAMSQEWIDPETVEPLALTDEQLARAGEMPDATWDHMPAWYGLSKSNVLEFSDQGILTCLFVRDDFETRAKYGFNFVRAQLPTGMFRSGGNGSLWVSKAILDNLDQAVAWAIEYKLHLCLCLLRPGFNGSSWDNAGYYDDALLQQMVDSQRALARRYQNIPNSVLSFNLFNEPFGMDLEDEEAYVRAVRAVAAAIRESTPDRLIIVDGLSGSQEPCYALAEDRVAQATHMYGPDSFLTGLGGAQWYMTDRWSYDVAISPFLWDDNAITFRGNFPAKLAVRVLAGPTDQLGQLQLWADGALVGSVSTVADHRDLDIGTLSEPATTLRLVWTSEGGDYFNITRAALLYPEETGRVTPIMDGSWGYSGMTTNEKLINIVFDNEPAFHDHANPVITIDDGSYSVVHDGRKAYTMGSNYFSDMLAKWKTFAEKTGVAVMVQEWGPYTQLSITDEAASAYTADAVKAMRDAGFPWCYWVDVLDTNRQDVLYPSDGARRPDLAMIDALGLPSAAQQDGAAAPDLR